MCWSHRLCATWGVSMKEEPENNSVQFMDAARRCQLRSRKHSEMSPFCLVVRLPHCPRAPSGAPSPLPEWQSAGQLSGVEVTQPLKKSSVAMDQMELSLLASCLLTTTYH